MKPWGRSCKGAPFLDTDGGDMIKDIIKSCGLIDFGEEVLFGNDMVYEYYAHRFPTVTFRLLATDLLDAIIEEKRRRKGYMEDDTVFYEYYLGINGYASTKMDAAIYAVVCNTDAGDEGECYDIRLTEDEQREMYPWLDVQCREYLGKPCDGLLEEARRKMEEEAK